MQAARRPSGQCDLREQSNWSLSSTGAKNAQQFNIVAFYGFYDVFWLHGNHGRFFFLCVDVFDNTIPDEIRVPFYLVLMMVFLPPTANSVMLMVELSPVVASNAKEDIARVVALQYLVAVPTTRLCWMDPW